MVSPLGNGDPEIALPSGQQYRGGSYKGIGIGFNDCARRIGRDTDGNVCHIRDNTRAACEHEKAKKKGKAVHRCLV